MSGSAAVLSHKSPDLGRESSESWRWTHIVASRMVRLAIGIMVLIVGSFFLIRLIGGDPVRAALGMDAPPELVARRRAELGLDDPILVQFFSYLGDLARLDFGRSIATNEPISSIVSARLGNTVALAAVAMLLVVVIAIPLGTLVGIRTQNGRAKTTDQVFGWTTGAALSIPDFILATVLVYVLAVELRVLPVGGKDGWQSYILPALSLAIPVAAFLARLMRADFQKVLGSDYMLTARSKRLPARVYYVRHALRNALTSTLTIGGLAFGRMLGGSVLIESIFAWPGLGTAAVNSLLRQDYPVAQTIIVLLGIIILVANALVDLALAILDPKAGIAER